MRTPSKAAVSQPAKIEDGVDEHVRLSPLQLRLSARGDIRTGLLSD